MKRFNYMARLASISTLLIALAGCQSTTTLVQNVTQPQSASQKPLNVQPTNPRLSVQLWSVNEQIKQDFEGTLRALADMGFEGVEFANYFGPYKDDPEGLKAFLTSIGLETSGAHVAWRYLEDSRIDDTIAFYQALGAPMLIVPNAKWAFNPQNIHRFVERMNIIHKRMEPTGMGFGFHNHARELVAYEDATYWDYLANQTADDFILQLDVGWATYAEFDAAELVRKYPGRTLTTHYKAMYKDSVTGKQPFIGEDITDWQAVIKANREVGGTLWLVVEQEEYPDGLSQLESVARSKQGLDKILRQL